MISLLTSSCKLYLKLKARADICVWPTRSADHTQPPNFSNLLTSFLWSILACEYIISSQSFIFEFLVYSCCLIKTCFFKWYFRELNISAVKTVGDITNSGDSSSFSCGTPAEKVEIWTRRSQEMGRSVGRDNQFKPPHPGSNQETRHSINYNFKCRILNSVVWHSDISPPLPPTMYHKLVYTYCIFILYSRERF